MGSVVYPDVCAVLLAGGRSRRMGLNKALITHNGKTILENLIEVVTPLTGEVLISANETGDYRFSDLQIVRDVYAGQGPLAGLHAAILHSEKPRFLLLASDMPNVNERLVRAILASFGESDAVVPRTSDGRNHPLCGVYRRTCFETLEQSLARSQNRVADFLSAPALKVRYFDITASGFPDDDLLNLNDKNDLHRLSSTREPRRSVRTG